MSMNKEFTGPLAKYLQGLLDEKRSLGFKYREQERLLGVLDKMSISFDCSDGLSKELCLEFVKKDPNWHQATQENRVALIRVLAEYMIRHDVPAYMLDFSIVTRQYEDFKPYIFNHDEIHDIFCAADNIKPHASKSHIFYPTLLRVQYGCGLRISETLNLTMKDVDFEKQLLHVKNAKNNKNREIPFSENAPEYMFQCHQIIGIPFKKTEKRVIGFLNEEKTRELLAAPSTDTARGLRDQALLCLLYDSGARVQELADIRIRDLRLDSPAQVQLTGKGRKTRSVPLMEQTVCILKEYMKRNGLDNGLNGDHPLFFNAQEKKLTRQGITYVLKKYAVQCGINDISPHQLRHTKAMHLTEANVNPVFIRDFLGHTDLKVTEIYSKTSVKMKREALKKMDTKEVIPADAKEWNEDAELMTWLKSL